MKRTLPAILSLLICGTLVCWLAVGRPASAQEDPGYRQSNPGEEVVGPIPSPTQPEPRGWGLRAIDLYLFVVLLTAAAVAIHLLRSRAALIVLAVFSLLYFGFYRNGCVCPIGSIQNVALSLVDSSYTISIVVTLLFLLPIGAALFLGRVFCGGVCWLGAAQDLVLRARRPIRVPLRLDKALRWGRWGYLAAAVYWAIGGANFLLFDGRVERDFLICKYDPFVNLFRSINVQAMLAGRWDFAFGFSGPWWIWAITGLVLGSAIFIGRPYCRWLCPYGAILGLCSRPALKPVTVMPDACCDCKLCDDACPFGAIEQHAAVNASCLACNRCYAACPLERQRRGAPVPEFAPVAIAESPPTVPSESPDRWPSRVRRPAPVVEELDVSYLDTLVESLGRGRSAALPILQAIQTRHRYLPAAALRRVVELTELTMGQLIGLATFYNQFRLVPIGEHLIRVCHGTACHVAGARRINDVIRLHLSIPDDGDTDPQRRFTVQEVACLGCCSLAPVMQIDGATFGHLTPEKTVEALDRFAGTAREMQNAK